MKQTFKIYLDTDEGSAIIASTREFTTLGPYTVTGSGKQIAKEWIKNAWGAFGHHVGTYAAPCDLHCAAMDLQQQPEDHIRFVRVEGEIKTYDSGLKDGEIP